MYYSKPPVPVSILFVSIGCILLEAITISGVSMGLVAILLLTLHSFNKYENWYLVPLAFFGALLLLGALIGITVSSILPASAFR